MGQENYKPLVDALSKIGLKRVYKKENVFDKIVRWWYWHKPILTTPKKQFEMLARYDAENDRITAKSNWSAINPVIHDLEKLRANTWDQDKITYIQNWLKLNFEVKNEEDTTEN